MSKNKKRGRSVIGSILWWLILLIAIAIFAFSAYKLLSIWMEYKAGSDEYNDLQQFAVTGSSSAGEGSEGSQGTQGSGEGGTSGQATPEEEVEEGPQIDFVALEEVNNDVVGWLYVEALEDINYPIVHGPDNDYYLHRTVKKTYNFAGSIFLEATNKPDFSDPHNIVFGHNMKNGSMFGQLRKFREREVYDKSRYFWICTPEKNYKYEIFSVQEVLSGGDAYLLFSAPGSELLEYAQRMEQQSEVKTPGITFTENSKIVTLSTCTTNTIKRLIVQGVLVN